MSSPLPLAAVVVLAAALFVLGMVAVLVRRNLLFVLLGLEIMLNSAGLVFIAAGSHWGTAEGQVMFMLLLAVAAAEAAVGLALLIRIHRRHHTLDSEVLRSMRG